ncbi:cell wall metabolism sensor histidine kinase WalK [Salipaludibacillus sp. LMS25]|jgi:two-component system phosphate regulon sensor histidine kinase PhoR|uniref:two-component system histidine kinase PnpS n=1 Tax=Salipaludibacillus sp. LMS25 TaxID=2924031 RepID=UPI0020D1CE02|nr:ATP-binding protein [Salipaludibacillus sp. LMS25]UTR15577.1 cell wall metabolism sensor histidine kinase WalK [Salipaludibacillus sp. LMS25]
MNSYRFRLIVPLSLIVLLVLFSLGAVLGPFFKDFYLERMFDRIEKETHLVVYQLEEVDITDETRLQERVSDIAERLDVRLTLIKEDGDVLAETAASPVEMDNHLSRPEIQSVMDNESGRETRYSETVGKELLYFALPFETEGGESGFIRLGVEMDELNAVYRNIWTLLFVSFFIAFLIILILATKLTNQMIKPVEDARRVANELAKGNFDARTYEVENLETGELNRSINVLAENLSQITTTYENQQERLETLIENMGSGLILINAKGDITLINRSCKELFDERTELWKNQLYYKVIKHKQIIQFIQEIFLTERRTRKQLKLSVGIYFKHVDVHGAPIIGTDEKLKGIVLVFHDITELKKLEQARKDFVANVSHELRTPVTSLKGFTETLLDGAMEDENLRKRFLTIIANESERLEGLIVDLLELSKIEGAKFQLNWQHVTLDSVVDEVFIILKNKAEAKKMTLEKKAVGSTCIEGDPHRIKQILINLVNNAIVYSPEGGRINVRVKEQTETVILEVEDTGIGINKKEIPRVFERFYRVDRARSRNSGGTGLGLAIVKHLAEAHHAKIAVESEVGKGTNFRLMFYKNRQSETED